MRLHRALHSFRTRRSSDLLDLALEKGLGCDTRHRFALSSVYDIPAYKRAEWLRLVTQNWHLSTVYQYQTGIDRKSTRLNSSHVENSYAVFCLKKKKNQYHL